MSQEKEVVKPDRWCVVQILDALNHANAMVSRIDDKWFPTSVKVEISKYYISIGSEALGYSISLNPQGVSVNTRNCSLIVFPDVLYLRNNVANIEERGKFLYIDPNYYYTGKDTYSSNELYEMIKRMFEKAIFIASSIIDVHRS